MAQFALALGACSPPLVLGTLRQRVEIAIVVMIVSAGTPEASCRIQMSISDRSTGYEVRHENLPELQHDHARGS
jgi:hypothetical protein